ncbi:hypothetical protein GF386_06325 [Candidatus Pacearchaeota archaeon]|nr:hypothetical protein [Candidatus Pacearchaeota archaeon]MBD3283705.1 hypothetical protein [Candidatus Pacearchaeota archaeon]
MKSKAPFILILIGGILGVLGGLFSLYYFVAMKIYSINLGDMWGINFFTNMYNLNIIFVIIHIALAIVFIGYSIKIARNPVKNDFIIITIFSVFGFLIGGMFFSGILILIGGIIGWIESDKEGKENKTQAQIQPVSVQNQKKS